MISLGMPKRAAGVRRVSFAGLLMNQLYGAHEAKVSEIAAELVVIA